MKTFRIILITLLTSFAVGVQAQKKDAIVLAKSSGYVMPRTLLQVDTNSQEETMRWPGTNNEWIKDSCWAESVPVAEHIERFFPNTLFDTELMTLLANSPDVKTSFEDYVPLGWVLAEEEKETVLHCYLRMPSDVLTHLWLASEEACLVDRVTGTQYRIRRTEPECTRKHLCMKAPKGEVLDLRVFFPPLPDTVDDVTIFGVPVWRLVGNNVKLKHRAHGVFNAYDTIPRLRQPRLLHEHLSENAPYDKQNWNTWRVYTDPHLIRPLDDYTMAAWLTPEATYLAMAVEQNWTTEYFGFEPGTMLLDEYGRQYHLREVQGLPLEQIFFMKGNAGDYFAFMLVFDPMPLDVGSFSYIEPDGEPFSAWGANWHGTTKDNLNVQTLRTNQSLFRYLPRQVVK